MVYLVGETRRNKPESWSKEKNWKWLPLCKAHVAQCWQASVTWLCVLPENHRLSSLQCLYEVPINHLSWDCGLLTSSHISLTWLWSSSPSTQPQQVRIWPLSAPASARGSGLTCSQPHACKNASHDRRISRWASLSPHASATSLPAKHIQRYGWIKSIWAIGCQYLLELLIAESTSWSF